MTPIVYILQRVILTLQVQIVPNAAQAAQLRATVQRFNVAANWLAGHAFKLHSANKVKLQQLHYRALRDQFGLSAQMAVRCIAQTCEAYSRDKTICPTFRPDAAMPLDQRLMSFKGVDRVSVLTLDGRIIMPILMGQYQRERFTAVVGQTDLVRRKDGKWFLLVTVTVPEGTPIPTTDFLGVDFGVVNIAVDSDGGMYTGAAVERVRVKQTTRRQTLQRAAALRKQTGRRPKAIRRALQRLGSKEARFRRHTNHVISKQLVATATDTGRGLALEDLTGIRDRTRYRHDQRARMSGWAFCQLRTFLEYKAQRHGVVVAIVDARHTSRTCPACGHCEKANRKTQAEFACRACGLALPADVVGALNIRARAAVNRPMFSVAHQNRSVA